MPLVADPEAARPKCELAHVFREYGADYRRTHRLPFSHRGVMQAIENCRTSDLGGHMEQCNLCGFKHPAYDSCLMGSKFLWGVECRKYLVPLADQVF